MLFPFLAGEVLEKSCNTKIVHAYGQVQVDVKFKLMSRPEISPRIISMCKLGQCGTQQEGDDSNLYCHLNYALLLLRVGQEVEGGEEG